MKEQTRREELQQALVANIAIVGRAVDESASQELKKRYEISGAVMNIAEAIMLEFEMTRNRLDDFTNLCGKNNIGAAKNMVRRLKKAANSQKPKYG